MRLVANEHWRRIVAGAGAYGGRPTIFVVVLFFLLFSGPPSLRVRDPMDSLDSIIDTTVIVQTSVWFVAGLWCLLQLRKDWKSGILPTLELPDKLGLLMIVFLGMSTFSSDAPLLTAFKVGQILVSLLFSWIFVYRYGIARCIDYIFMGSTGLCVAIAISSFLAPSLVFFSDEGHMRLRGDPIAVMGTVGTYSTILLFTKRKRIPKTLFWSLLGMLCTLLALSLTRHAWFLVLTFALLYFSRKSKGAVIRNLGLSFLIVFPPVFVFYILPALQDFRATDSIWTLTGRTDLWMYLAQVALTKAAWTGLGYYSASRLLGIDFNPGMGTAHSIFIEVLLGGGLLSLVPCIALCFSVAHRAIRLLSAKRTELEFVAGALYLVTLVIALMGGDFASGEIGITFWSLTAAIPILYCKSYGAHGLANVSSPRFARPANVPTLPRAAHIADT